MKKDILKDKLVWPAIGAFVLTFFTIDFDRGLLDEIFIFFIFMGVIGVFKFLSNENYLTNCAISEDSVQLFYKVNFSKEEQLFTIDMASIESVKPDTSKVSPYHTISIKGYSDDGELKEFVIKVKGIIDLVEILYKLRNKVEEDSVKREVA